MTAARRSPETIRLRTYYVARFGRACPLESATAREIEGWLAGQRWSDETARSALSSLVNFYRWAVDYEQLVIDPTRRLARIREAPPLPHPVPESIYRDRLASSPERESLAIRLAGEAGLRRAEAAQVSDADLIETLGGPVLLVHGKGGKDRRVPVSAEFARVIAAACKAGGGWAFPSPNGGHLTPGHLGRLVSGELGAGYTIHGLRHRFASICYARTRDIVAVQELMGHANIATTRRYIAMNDNRLRDVAAAAA